MNPKITEVELYNGQGFVELIDYMGSDYAILESARVSTGADAIKGDKKDRGLIRYLYTQKHMSPFEMAEFKFKVKVPIFVQRQWCITGGSELHFEKNGYRRKENVEDIYNRFHQNKRIKNQVSKRHLRSYSHSDDLKSTTNIKDIWKSGNKETYKVTIKTPLETFEITCSGDHPFLTKNGYKSLKDFTILPTEDNQNWGSYEEVMVIGQKFDNPENKVDESYTNPLIDESNEVWKPIKDYSLYEASNFGRIRNKETKKIKKQFIPNSEKNKNYKRLSVSVRRDDDTHSMKRVIASRLIFSAFYDGDIDDGLVCHKDGNPLNNNIENLYLGSHKDNSSDADYHGTLRKRKISSWFSGITNIEYTGVQEVYDIEVTSEDHNFVCGGFVVHNCRHRAGKYNEASARYKKFEWDVFYPDKYRVQDIKNKQSSYEVDGQNIGLIDNLLNKSYETSKESYEYLLSEGIAREQARSVMPVGHFTEFFFKMDFRNLLHFLELRMHEHAQKEIQEPAKAIYDIIESTGDFKWSLEIFDEVRKLDSSIQKKCRGLDNFQDFTKHIDTYGTGIHWKIQKAINLLDRKGQLDKVEEMLDNLLYEHT